LAELPAESSKVAALLGHSRLDTIRIYSQPDQDALQRAADLLEQR